MTKFFFLGLIVSQFLFGWGSTGHKIINKNAVKHLPFSMQKFVEQQSFLETHSTDADTRRTSDTAMFSEQYRHYLDVDDYPDFKNLDRSFDKLVAVYGWSRVKGNGTNPWTIVWVMDTLTAQLKRGDMNAALQSAADLGHYVGDPHQPLHAAVNYNGQLTGNTGIHSRYESTMLNKFQSEISIATDTVKYISDVYAFAFKFILESNALVDSILHADNYAKLLSGWNGSGTPPSLYYDMLWEQLGAMTKVRIQQASIHLASLWYTSWVNAGLIAAPVSVTAIGTSAPRTFNLYQNYPNPFNPTTSILFDVAEPGNVRLEIISTEGKTIVSLVDHHVNAGSYRLEWNASQVASGAYIVRLLAGNQSLMKKILFVK